MRSIAGSAEADVAPVDDTGNGPPLDQNMADVQVAVGEHFGSPDDGWKPLGIG